MTLDAHFFAFRCFFGIYCPNGGYNHTAFLVSAFKLKGSANLGKTCNQYRIIVISQNVNYKL